MQGRRRMYRIAFNLSMQAYVVASKEYNAKIDKDKEKLKDTHFSLFFQLLKKLSEKVIKQPLSELNKLRITRGELGAIFDRHPQTMSARLKRLELADILKIKFHGHKAPLELILDPNVVLLRDVLDMNFVPKSKFLKISKSVLYESFVKDLDNIKATELTRTDINITIPDTVVTKRKTGTYQNKETGTHKNTGTPKANCLFSELSPSKKETAEQMAKEISSAENISFEKALHRVMKGVQPENKNQSSAENQQTIPSDNQPLTIDYKAKNQEIVHEILHKEKQRKAKTLEEKRRQVRLVYVKMFIHYLIDSLFVHTQNQITPKYYKRLTEYVYQNYFADCQTIKSLDYRWEQYKFRVDIAKKSMDDYENFNTDYFYPLAYLKVEKKGKKHFSFQNTEAFWKKQLEWNKIKGYNGIRPDLLKKLNSIARRVENESLNYDDAIQKIKSLTIDSSELLRQFESRMRANVQISCR
jgi:hypothetical protein